MTGVVLDMLDPLILSYEQGKDDRSLGKPWAACPFKGERHRQMWRTGWEVQDRAIRKGED